MAKRKPKRKKLSDKGDDDFVPMSESSLKGTVEVLVKDSGKPVEVVEKKGKVRKQKKTAKKKSIGSPKPIKEKGYELVITEKPQAALKIAASLGKSIKKNIGGVPYYEVDRGGRKIIVGCAVGHLFTLKQEKNKGLPIFDISWVPNFSLNSRSRDFSKKYYSALSKLAKNAASFTVATDYDIEGEVIGWNVLRFICGQKDASRMKFSTLTSDELNRAYENKMRSINWGQAIAGETRHYLDWFYGINLSRALMNAIKAAGSFRIMSVGRVQGPALNLIVEREKKIQEFKPRPYWQIFANVKNSCEMELKHEKDIFDKQELEKFNGLVGKKGKAFTKKSEQKIPPGMPFDLTTLQTEAYKFHGITPSKTLQIAQSLYLSGLISYPRTSSQKLPDSVEYRKILDKLSKKYNFKNLIKRTKPVEGKRSDPAHPSIYPTGELKELSGDDSKIYELIARRFIALFCEDALVENKNIKAEIGGMRFGARGMEVKKRTWMDIYPVKMQEKELPDLKGEVKVVSIRKEEKETKPPRRYSPASIVTELSKRNLGTKATRAAIIETLYNRDYIKERQIHATPLGVSLIETLRRHSPVIIDEKLTRYFEREMANIEKSKKDLGKKEEAVISKAKKIITDIIRDFEKHEKEIGGSLLRATDDLREQQRKENMLQKCPVCKQGNLRILYNRNLKRYFVACDAYPKCRTTYTLPNGLIKPAGKVCESCRFPLLMLIKSGKRPWQFCFNPECPKRKEA